MYAPWNEEDGVGRVGRDNLGLTYNAFVTLIKDDDTKYIWFINLKIDCLWYLADENKDLENVK